MKLACLISGYNNPVSIKDNVKREEKHVNLIPTKTKQQVKFFNNLAPPLAAAFLLFSPICATPVSIAQTIDIQRGATLFSQTCIGCHDAGGNIIQPGSTLFTKDLQRNGVDTEEEIYRVTYYGKGRMPGFGKECMPRGQCTFGARLEDEDIKILAEFVKLQADKGWPSIETEQK
ncbi:putative cytochrome c-like domain-containing protein [Medicago truncatula]|uniref:Cytochrome c-553 n=1 Tax=Medicago truncatula TaxID=3880 RepID=A2Q293_MEDTR|nr:cytochrome c6, chloroplastic [Medicago truncatula]ABN06030.1 Cytochrome c, monohaem [Medicago truncatula]AES90075.1 cytochrome protein C [Medicago truncatula]RHN62089.1 putative cytochrome c-like domain-containing protein [Medicago truncatula]